MIKHIVFWALADEAEGASKAENAQKIRESLEALVGVVPGLLKAEVRTPFNQGGYDVVLYSELESRGALAGYQTHPAHVAVREFVHKVTVSRAAADYEV